jgi:hypothetical protein
MKVLRPVVLAVLIAAAFLYFTSRRSGELRPPDWPGNPSRVEVSEAASNESLDPEEQNNISVYRGEHYFACGGL